MNDRAAHLHFANLLDEVKRRQERKRQSAPGGLMAFIRYFWHVLEPETPLVEGWTMEAICEHLEAVTRGDIRRLLINVPPGFCKPVHVDEPVLTRRGRIRLGDVTIGDQVLTHKGRYRSVEAVHAQGLQSLLSVATYSGRRVRVEPSHPFLTTRGWIEARSLRVGDILAAIVPQEDVFIDQITAQEARLLGYLVGDGGVTHSPGFTNNDEEILKDFEYCAAYCGMETGRASRIPPSLASHNMKATKVGLRRAVPWLEKHGLKGKSSYTKRIPLAVLNSGTEIIANFLGAYWSCDGTIKVRHERKRGDLHLSSCTTVSRELAYDVQHALLRIGINTRVRVRDVKLESKKQPGGLYRSYQVMTTSHNEAVKFFGMPGLCSRKRLPFGILVPQKFNQGPLVEDEIIEIKADGEGECRCLTVADDASFTISDLAVHNSLIVDVFWPAWEWGPMGLAHLRYVTFSYTASLTERDNERFRDLIVSQAYRELWPNVSPIKTGATKVTNTKKGWKLASSVGGVGTGERGDRVILDDPNNVKEAESETVRDETNRWFRESMSNRLNSLETGVIVIIMQRVHEEDVSGLILSLNLDYEHLVIPMEFDWARVTDESGQPYQTVIGWVDPRWVPLAAECDGKLAWPERFPQSVIDQTKHEVGPFAYAGQYMQTPEPRGGGIFKREFWQLWQPPDGKFPEFEYIVASLDSAFTKNTQNDPSALTVWGVFLNERGQRRIMLILAWRKFLEMHGPKVEKKPDEHVSIYRQRAMQHWGLVEWVADSCRVRKVDRLLIEGKASGISAAQELMRLHGREGWAIQLCPVKGDKEARALAVQPTFSQGMVYAPVFDWAEMVKDEMAVFPKGKFDDLTDSATQCIKHLRDIGLAQTDEEVVADDMDRVRHRPRMKALYPTA